MPPTLDLPILTGRRVAPLARRPPPPAARGRASPTSAPPGVLHVQPDAADAWRLDPVVDALKQGRLVVLPTDSYPALAVDARLRDAAARLYEARRIPAAQRKPLALLARGFADIAEWTAGFPRPAAGGVDLFRVAKRALPGPYTLILPASGRLKHVWDAEKGKSKARRTVGVRLPAHAVTAAVLASLDAPLLVTSASSPNDGPLDAATLADVYEARGADVAYVVDAGGEGAVGGSTVIDLTSGEAEVVREGLGDASVWLG